MGSVTDHNLVCVLTDGQSLQGDAWSRIYERWFKIGREFLSNSDVEDCLMDHVPSPKMSGAGAPCWAREREGQGWHRAFFQQWNTTGSKVLALIIYADGEVQGVSIGNVSFNPKCPSA
jgi:hypothetical protein